MDAFPSFFMGLDIKCVISVREVREHYEFRCRSGRYRYLWRSVVAFTRRPCSPQPLVSVDPLQQLANHQTIDKLHASPS